MGWMQKMIETSKITGLLGAEETQSFVRGENTFNSDSHDLCERSRQWFKLLVFYIMTLLVQETEIQLRPD